MSRTGSTCLKVRPDLSRATATLILIFVTLSLNKRAQAAAAVSPQPVLYLRCYAELTGLRAPTTDPLYLQVKSGALSAAEACLQLVKRAQLSTNGDIGNHADTVSIGLLNTLHAFHRSWFARSDMINDVSQGDSWATSPEVYDTGEPALYLTRALFKPGANFREVLTLPNTLEAIRDNYKTAQVAIAVNFSNAATTVVPAIGAPIGTLYGIRDTNAVLNLNGRNDLRQSVGGGAIGTKSYLILNMGRIPNEASDGGRTVARRYSKDVMSDLLCRELPVMRPSDAIQFVNSSSSLQFRKSSSCTQCHGTMDNLAGVTRNFQLDPFPATIAANGVFMGVTGNAVTTGVEAGPVDSDPSFKNRPSNGHLYFRTFDGTWVNQSITSVASLGSTLATLDDPYVCAAKRYYQFMTGVTVVIDDIGSPTATALTTEQTRQRDFVISLGKKLKQDQSLPNLIYRIVDSDAFKTMTSRAGN